MTKCLPEGEFRDKYTCFKQCKTSTSGEIRLYHYVNLPTLEFTNDETHKYSAIPRSKAKLTKAYKHILLEKQSVLVCHNQ